MVLSFFSRDKGDHPLADPKEAKQALAALAGADSSTLCHEVTAWLESLAAAQEIRLERRAELVLQLDETAAAAARLLAREYLTASRSRTVEFRLWQRGHDYWVSLAAAYESVLVRAADVRGNPLKAFLPLLFARLLQALGGVLKWSQFRYGPIDGVLWQRAGRAYLSAVAVRQAEEPVRLYDGTNTTSVAAEYLKLLLFHAASMGNLLPLEIEMAERLLGHFLSRFTLTDQPGADSVYWVDATQPRPPGRLLQPPTAAAGLRYFTTGAAHAEIEILRDRVTGTGMVPAEIPLGGQYPVETVVRVLDHLAMCCAPHPPQRHADRQRLKSLLAVIHGMDEIRLRLTGDEGTQDGETWIAEDVSRGGFGAQISLAGNDWIRVGALIGLRLEGSEHWVVGLVRRFSRDNQSVGSVGVEIVGHAPRTADLDCSGLRSDAILLNADIVVGNETRVILPAGSWEDFMPVILSWQKFRTRLSPRGIAFRAGDLIVGVYCVDEIETV
ncbi:MAG: hypothetical protein JSR19_08560 [Proteobacteria bacterium]|nr:hypothetical protein [Pseudomonadota bacterium]HQR04188.1 hypothetical protein [Rhodocyclaceae bacterium]